MNHHVDFIVFMTKSIGKMWYYKPDWTLKRTEVAVASMAKSLKTIPILTNVTNFSEKFERNCKQVHIFPKLYEGSISIKPMVENVRWEYPPSKTVWYKRGETCFGTDLWNGISWIFLRISSWQKLSSSVTNGLEVDELWLYPGHRCRHP